MSAISSLLLPMQQKPLLVPSVSVVEVVAYRRPQELEQQPDWFLGGIPWRGKRIPLISIERLNQKRFTQGSPAIKIAIFSATAESSKEPFYGVVIQGMPQLMELESDDLVRLDAGTDNIEQMPVSVRGLAASIPNLSLIEKQISEQLTEITPEVLHEGDS